MREWGRFQRLQGLCAEQQNGKRQSDLDGPRLGILVTVAHDR